MWCGGVSVSPAAAATYQMGARQGLPEQTLSLLNVRLGWSEEARQRRVYSYVTSSNSPSRRNF